MSGGSPWSRARPWLTRRGHALGHRLHLERWYPHLPIAFLTAPLGVLLIGHASREALGVGPASVGITELELHVSAVHHTPILEFAIGASLVVIALGLALRSRLAWLWAVAAFSGSLVLRVFYTSDPVLIGYVGALLLALIVYRGRFRSHNLVSSSVFAVTAIATFLMWATLGTLRLGSHFEPPIRDLVTALYFTVVTISSVGFGDIVPADDETRLFVSMMVLVGIFVGATAFSTILLPLVSGRLREFLGGRSKVDRSGHYVIVGKSPLARNATVELERRGQKVTLVLDRSVEEDFYRTRDVVVGDPTDLAVLRSAGTERALGVLALSTDDAENGFAVLGVNEIDPSIRTVAALNDPTNESRLKRTQPSLLLSLQSLGGELLAMALTGERIDVEMLGRVLQLPGAKPAPGK